MSRPVAPGSIYSPSMPSTTPPILPHYTSATSLSQYIPTITGIGTTAHSWERSRFHHHQPAAIYDPTSSHLDSHAFFSLQDYAPTDHIFLPFSFTFSSPDQQAIPPTSRYPSPMSRHPAWAYPGYAQRQSANSPVDTHASSFTPPVAQKVWLLECKHCRTFLTNRGMKAVLLLRPHVPLYSTDALPANCSAYSLRSPTIESPHQHPIEQQPRTCDCLTQTLCCHGCGTNVGYMIVVPCARCISSGATTNRVTNGHRFVFHSSELTASERHYVSGELGILPAYTEQSSSPSSPSSPLWPPRSFLPSTPDPAEMNPSLAASPAFASYNAMPPPAPESPCPASLSVFADPQKPSPQRLRTGDLLYWHHLKQGGEIPGATDDPRARGISPNAFDR